jgi:peptidoglycan/xylan/chitin deacetylase (PgdA/CDA1 family)
VRIRTTSGAFAYVALGSVPAAASPQTFVRSFTAPADAASVTVFHLIAGVGSLTIDDVSLTKNPDGYNLFAQGMVSLQWDDGFKATFDIVKPALDVAGLPSTHFIVTGFFGDPDYVSTADVLALQASGHEIGAHSRTHRDLTKLSASAVSDEIVGSRQDLLAIGVTSVASFAYPYGAYNDNVLLTTKDAGYNGARSVLNGNVERSDDPYTLRRFGMQGGVTFDQARAAIDNAVAQRQWLVLVFHHVDNSGSYYSVTPELFQQVIDYLVAQRTLVVTMSQGLGTLVK